ncbi:hypothetical protein [Nocardia africana]
MTLRFLGKGGSRVGDCPALYVTESGHYIVVGWRTEVPATIEIPHLLTGFAMPDTFIGALMTDTGRGTFRLAGVPVTDRGTVAALEMEDCEEAIEVPMERRAYYGGVAAA